MRFEWVVYSKLQNEKAKTLVGTDILVRSLKKMLSHKTSKMFKLFKMQSSIGFFEASAMKEKYDELANEAYEYLIENYHKKLLSEYVNSLVKGHSDAPDDEDKFYAELQTEIFFQRMRALDVAKKVLEGQAFENFLSSEIICNTINMSCMNANLFLDAIQHHMHVSINYEALRLIRTDKFMHWVSSYGSLFKPIDFNFVFNSENYITIKERCFILLLKMLPSLQQQSSNTPVEITLPSSLYKYRRGLINDHQSQNFDCVLRDFYEIPDLEILNDWVVLLEGTLNGLYTTDGQHTFLIEAYITQLVLAFFADNESDNQVSLTILERINNFVNNSPVCSPELLITIHTWFGILSENKLFVECEQSYSMALLTLHKLYGDPRGRGAVGTPWELFITWRLSILSRLQGKVHDAEYVEELFDATCMNLRDNPLNQHLKSHAIYSDPFKELYANTFPKNQNSSAHLHSRPNFKTMKINEHPFPYWTHYLLLDENASKVDTVNSTMQKSPQMLKWIMTHMLTFQSTGILWDTAYLRDFFLSIMQSSFMNMASVSSVSGYSTDGKKDKTGTTGIDGTSTPRSSALKFDKKEKKFNQGGNLVQIFEKDASTVNKKELNGTVFAWGQNTDGQVGTPISNVEELDQPGQKKMRIYYPKSLLTLKDTVILSVSCGHTHSLAITITRRLLAWGCNKSSQLGLGEKVPNVVFVPTLVPNLVDVMQVSCGSEHTVALLGDGFVYSWGQGEGGLLGHGDLLTQTSPKVINSLKGVDVQSIVCGGLHTIALTKQGVCYAWGRGEGGQLGIPFDQQIHDQNTNELYLPTPKKIRGALDSINVVQVACGDAHSLALAQNGVVYGFGYTNSGQLGLGVTQDNYVPNSKYSLQVKEPTIIEKLHNIKITEIFAGSTFSLFLNDKKELYGCGLNDYNQLGIEKNIMKVTNLDNYKQAASNKTSESSIPKKIDCFTSMPILKVTCGENHSLALVLYDSYYMLFAWGMHRHAQLGIGDIQSHFSTPRHISFLQYVMIYSMACGAYHSLVVLGEASKSFKREALVERLERKVQNRWNSVFFEAKDNYEAMIELALNNLDNIIPSEEGKIDNPKAINKIN